MKRTEFTPPPLPPQLPPKPIYGTKKTSPRRISFSVTNDEIAKFWRQKRMAEEDHFLAATKASALIRARNFSEKDYKLFLESLDDDNNNNATKKVDMTQDIRVGIKDWWTKSKYAYLNEPIIESTNKPKLRSTYIPHSCFYKTNFSTVDYVGIY